MLFCWQRYKYFLRLLHEVTKNTHYLMKKICRTLSAIFQRVYYQLFAIWQSLIAKLWAPTVFTTMITTSSLQNYKKLSNMVDFLKNLK